MTEYRKFLSDVKPLEFISFGAGVQTTYLAYAMGKDVKRMTFADTGDEKPETYEYLGRYIIPFCEENKIDFRIVQSPMGSLYEYSFTRGLIPTRRFRWCTAKFKIRVIRNWLRKEMKVSNELPALQHIGISWDEAHRMHEADVKYVKNSYPLIDGYKDLVKPKTTRQDCIDGIKSMGYPVPPKSGCYYCPYSKKAELKELKEKHPELWMKAITLETANSEFPRLTLRGEPLEKWVDDEEDDSCESGYCMV